MRSVECRKMSQTDAGEEAIDAAGDRVQRALDEADFGEYDYDYEYPQPPRDRCGKLQCSFF